MVDFVKYDPKYIGHPATTSTNYFHFFVCSHCSAKGNGIVIGFYFKHAPNIFWILCPSCSHGSVIDRDGNTYPPIPYGENVEGLPPELKLAFNEARNVFSIGAFTSCQLICRKMLMHIAIDKCNLDEGKSFIEYVNALEKAQLISPLMKPWVDKIRKEGNDATHKLEPPSKDDSENILNFVTQLLKVIYEMEYKMQKFGQTESKT